LALLANVGAYLVVSEAPPRVDGHSRRFGEDSLQVSPHCLVVDESRTQQMRGDARVQRAAAPAEALLESRVGGKSPGREIGIGDAGGDDADLTVAGRVDRVGKILSARREVGLG